MFQAQNGFNSWEAFGEWFMEAPLLIQVALILFTVAVTALVLIGVFYLLYYLFKGLYYLFKGIFTLIGKLFKGIYYAMTGRSKEEGVEYSESQLKRLERTGNQDVTPRRTLQESEPMIQRFCSQCGARFSDRMMEHMQLGNVAFCERCGKEFKRVKQENESVSSALS